MNRLERALTEDVQLLKLGKQLTDGKRLNRPLQLQHAVRAPLLCEVRS